MVDRATLWFSEILSHLIQNSRETKFDYFSKNTQRKMFLICLPS